MAKYSVELWELIQAGVNIFDFDYDVYGTHKTALQNHIIERYYYREIGFETPGRFIHYLKVKLRSIMPVYNEVYRLLEENRINILSNQKVVIDDTNDTTLTHGAIVDTVNDNKILNAETPQGELDITANGSNVSNINKSNNTGKITNSGNDKTVTHHDASNTGYNAITEAELILKFIKNPVDVDDRIADELDILFHQLF